MVKEDYSENVQELMNNPKALKKWFVSKKKEFDELPEDK